MNLKKLWLLFLPFLLATSLSAQVLGACGDTGGKATPSVATKTTAQPASANALAVQPMPLPGQQAIDFQLPAVVGNHIKMVKLSDYAGKWRVLCFFPAAFTFV